MNSSIQVILGDSDFVEYIIQQDGSELLEELKKLIKHCRDGNQLQIKTSLKKFRLAVARDVDPMFRPHDVQQDAAEFVSRTLSYISGQFKTCDQRKNIIDRTTPIDKQFKIMIKEIRKCSQYDKPTFRSIILS